MDSIDKQIFSLKNKGDSLRQIAKKVGISHVAVKKHLDKLTATRLDDKPDQESDTIIVEANLVGFEYKHPMEKASITGVVSRLNSVLEELNLNETNKEIVIDAGFGWKFEKVPW